MKAVFMAAAAATVWGAWAEQSGPLDAAESMARMVVPEDVQVTLVAAEPEIFDPVALAFDAQGALYVVEDRGYPSDDSGVGDVALLRDKDGDGYYETRTVFADGLTFPNGVMPWRDGVLVTCAPDVYYFKDTDGDDRADIKEVFLKGFSLGGSTQLRVSHPTFGLDNWIYFTNGLSGGEISVLDHPESGSVTMGANDMRYQPFTHALETTAGQAQFGLTFNDWGDKFVCSNRKHIEHVVLQPEDLARNPYLGATQTVAQIPEHGEAARIYPLSENRTTAYSHQGTFTAACGLVIYRGDGLPQEYRGNGFVCDPTGNLVHRDVLIPEGATFVARRAEQEKEFLATTDNWSRPVFLANGPDGALYMCDMYRKTIEHPTYLPPEVAAVTDFDSGKQHGRIYRITGKDDSRAPREIENDVAHWAKLLDHPNAWHRETVHRLVVERQDISVADAVRGVETPLGHVHALYVLDALGALEQSDLEDALAHEHAVVREHALRLARSHPEMLKALRATVVTRADDADARVRFVCALALGDLKEDADARALAAIAARDIDDAWTRPAVVSSAAGVIAEFASAFVETAPRDAAALPETIRPIARCLAMAEPPKTTAAWLDQVLGHDPAAWQWAALMGVLDGIHTGKQFEGAGAAWDRLAAEAPPSLKSKMAALLSRAMDTAREIGAAASDVVPASNTAPRRGDVDPIVAVELLGYMTFESTRSLFEGLLVPEVPQEIRVAAVQALGVFRNEGVGTFLVDQARWQSFTPAVRTAALNVLLSRESHINALLDALENGAAPLASVDTLSRGRLTRSRNEAIANRAKTIFQSAASSDRAKVFEEYKEVLKLDANVAAGREAFATFCGICHEFQGEGKLVGPNLSDIHMQPAESILLHIIEPNREIVAGYEQYNVETKDGELYSGIIASETATSVTLLQAMGVEQVIPRSEIASITTSELSMMPEELEKGFSKQTMRDLIGYLKAE